MQCLPTKSPSNSSPRTKEISVEPMLVFVLITTLFPSWNMETTGVTTFATWINSSSCPVVKIVNKNTFEWVSMRSATTKERKVDLTECFQEFIKVFAAGQFPVSKESVHHAKISSGLLCSFLKELTCLFPTVLSDHLYTCLWEETVFTASSHTSDWSDIEWFREMNLSVKIQTNSKQILNWGSVSGICWLEEVVTTRPLSTKVVEQMKVYVFTENIGKHLHLHKLA